MSQYFLFSSKCCVLSFKKHQVGFSKGSLPSLRLVKKKILRNIITCSCHHPTEGASFEVETYTKEASQSLIKSYKAISILYLTYSIR